MSRRDPSGSRWWPMRPRRAPTPRFRGSPAACRGQDVTLVVASKLDGIIHIHGYDATVPATEVKAGEELRLTFEAERSGQFPIELHPAGDPQGIGVGVFTVHEP